MATSRENRFLQRQRGAGKEIKDFGFSLAIPQFSAGTPAGAGATPQARTRSARRSIRSAAATPRIETPSKPEGPATKRRRISERTPAQPSTIPETIPGTTMPEDNEAGLEDIPEGDDEPAAIPEPPTSSTKKRKKRKSVTLPRKKHTRPSIEEPTLPQIETPTPAPPEVAEDDGEDEISSENISSSVRPRRSLNVPTVAKLVSPKQRKKRKSIGAKPKTHMTRAPEPASEDQLSEPTEEPPAWRAESPRKPVNRGRRLLGLDKGKEKEPRPATEVPAATSEDEPSWLKAPQSGFGRRTRTIEYGSAKKKTPLGAIGGNYLSKQRQPQREASPLVEKVQKRGSGRPSQVASTAQSKKVAQPEENEEDEVEEEADELEQESPMQEEESHPDKENEKGRRKRKSLETSKASKEKPKKSVLNKVKDSKIAKRISKKLKPSTSRAKSPRQTSPSATEAESEPPKKKDKGDAIPITVHRISRVHSLNFIPGEDDDLAGPAPFPKKSSVNAIDVLGQVCREIIGKSISALKRTVDNDKEKGEVKKTEVKRKRKAVEMFGDELDGRLFQTTTALDNNYTLNLKLRQASKEKAGVRDDLLELREKREDVKVKMDEVRERHERAVEAAEDAGELDQMLHDIELVVQRCRAMPVDPDEGQSGLELRLREVSDLASSKGGNLGLLDRVKGFNAFLESSLKAL